MSAQTQPTKLMPIQKSRRLASEHNGVRESVYMRAYEVYSHCYGEQQAMLDGECRGGFGIGELCAFLYAHSFPRDEWKSRVDEAFAGMML